MYELIGRSVTSGIIIELGKLYPEITRYREAIPVNLIRYPHFFVTQLTVDKYAERFNTFIVNYFINIRYHFVADPSSTLGNLQENLDQVAINLLANLDYIYFDGKPVYLREKRVEKKDGVLHFFANIAVMTNKLLPEDPKQTNLDENINMKI